MIKSANQHPVFALMSPQSNVLYRVPPYQREYSWQKAQWEALFDDLIEAEGPHFLGTIICLDQSVDAVEATIYDRARMPSGLEVAGPVVIESFESTILVPPGWRAAMNADGFVLLAQAHQG